MGQPWREQERPEAASMLPQASALLPRAGFGAGGGGWHRGSGTLLQPPEDLDSALLVQAYTHQLAGVVIQGPVALIPFDRHSVCSPRAQGQSVCPAPGWRYRPLHQPSAVLWLYHVLPSFPWFSFITTLCLGQCGV